MFGYRLPVSSAQAPLYVIRLLQRFAANCRSARCGTDKLMILDPVWARRIGMFGRTSNVKMAHIVGE